MSNSSPDRCGYTWSRDREILPSPGLQSCCWRETHRNSDHCIWHAKPETVTKSVQALQDARTPSEAREQTSGYVELLNSAKLAGVGFKDAISFEKVAMRDSDLSDTDLRNADLQGAELRNADLSDANLRDADLRKADLRNADLSDAYLRDTNLSDVDLRNANLSDAYLRDANLSDADLRNADLEDAGLRNADLEDANLRYADLADATLSEANLSDTKFADANLSDASLYDVDTPDAEFTGADLSNAALANNDLSNVHLQDADLSDSDLSDADLSEADLSLSDLSDANLSGADLTGANLREATLKGDVSVNGSTTCRRLHEEHRDRGSIACTVLPNSLGDQPSSNSSFDAGNWDATARAYHTLKTVFDAHGLIDKARNMHAQERRARSLEAKAADGWISLRYLGSLSSRVFTGSGVGVLKLGVWMLLLFSLSTALYVSEEVRPTLLDNISYSVLAFTVAPPPPMPSGGLTQLVMMVETFFGTLSIVLMGYILGNREQF